MAITGNLTVDGSVTYINTIQLNVSDNIIEINSGLTGTPSLTMVSGMKVNRGAVDPYFFIFSETDDTFRIGSGAEGTLPLGTQAVATRQDAPVANGVGYWNDTVKRIDTSIGFTFVPGTGLSLPIATNDGAEATALLITPAGLVVSRELGTAAFATIANYATLAYVDGSIAARDVSIARVAAYASDVSSNKLSAVTTVSGITGGHEVYSITSNNTAYIKKILAGSGATIISDTSTITISVSGVAGYVSKYTGTFNGTSGTSLSVLVGTHLLGVGPFNVTVYDGTQLVYVDVDVDGSGNVTFNWSSGSLSASCKYIIAG
jgi:hypothetical protein